MVTGIESFKEWFKGNESQYAIIGGTACDILMTEEGLDFRATKDIDLVLIIEAVDAAFGRKFWDYKKGKKRYIVLLIAFLFHYSSVLFMLMCFIFELCKRKKYKTLYKGIILVLTITAFAFIPSILQFLAQMFGGFAGKYYQTFIMKQSASNGISWTETALRGTLLLGPVIAFIKNKENEEWCRSGV